jgi:hypothetical protein
MKPNIIASIGIYVEKQGAEQILDGTFNPPQDCDPYLRDLIEEMQMEDRVRAAGFILTNISLAEHQQRWKKQKEHTALVRSGLSFSNHKAACQDDNMAEIGQLLREIPYQQGFSPELYQVITNFEILKKSGVYDVEK